MMIPMEKSQNCKVTNSLFQWKWWCILDKICWKLGGSEIIDCHWRTASIHLDDPPSLPLPCSTIPFESSFSLVGIPNADKRKWNDLIDDRIEEDFMWISCFKCWLVQFLHLQPTLFPQVVCIFPPAPNWTNAATFLLVEVLTKCLFNIFIR